MEYGAHLPLLDLDGRGSDVAGLTSYARTARELGYRALTANDHLVFQRPWLDGIVALASVVEASGDLTLATTVSLPVVRGPAALAKAAAALDMLSGGRLVLGVGPGSSRADYALAGVEFEERWPRFDAAVRELRAHLGRDSRRRDAGAGTTPDPPRRAADLDRQLGVGRRACAGWRGWATAGSRRRTTRRRSRSPPAVPSTACYLLGRDDVDLRDRRPARARRLAPAGWRRC